MREKLHKFVIGLIFLFLADGLLMTWALLKGGYTFLGYFNVSYAPVFIPAAVASLIISVIYVNGFMRRAWRPQTLEWIFLLVFVVALAAKIILVVRRHSG
jgi:hypothetical protein